MTANDGNPGAESSTAPTEDEVLEPGSDAASPAGEASDQQPEPESPDDGAEGSQDPSLDERIGGFFDEDAGFSETQQLSDDDTAEEPDGTGQGDDPVDAGVDQGEESEKPAGDQPAEEPEDLAHLELTEEDKKAAPRTQKRIKTLLDRAKAAEERVSTYGEHIDFVREKAGMSDEEIVTSIYDIARIRAADPDMLPVLEQLADQIRETRGIAAPATPSLPEVEPFTGELPKALKDAVEYGDLSEEKARHYAALDQTFAKAKERASKPPEPPAKPAAPAQPHPQQVDAYRQQVQATNQRVATFLQAQGVKDLAAYYRDLTPVILQEAGVASVDEIPLSERFIVVKDAHRALQERRLQEAQQRAVTRDKRRPVRQNGQGGPGARTHKPKSVASFYDEDLDA